MIEDRYLHKLEYFKIIDQLAQHTSFSAGRQEALALRPAEDWKTVARSLAETTEAKGLVAARPDIGVGAAHDVRPLLKKAALESLLQPQELLAVKSTLISAKRMRQLLTRFAAQCPLLAEKTEELQPFDEIIDEIARCLDEDGRMLDSASPALAAIRRESIIARERLVERLQRIVSSSDNARYLQDSIITERNGRYVVPLKADFKGRIPGIIHDQSSSGATIFVEPLETVELNNRWRQLQLDEKREIERILLELTLLVGREEEGIERDVLALAELDLALAKGRYSFALRAAPAELSKQRWPSAESGASLAPSEHPLNLLRARHPLLPVDSAVPIDVYMGGDYTALLVTGPNTGGKTVALKTVGLLAAMTQAGLHIPAMDGSKLPVFNGIYADIGDEQSIEQSLSTFSSHLSHIVEILAAADEGSLVLLDELGAGTDPVEGAALAQSLLLALLERRCLTMCSTHYSQLKLFVFGTPGAQNASVEFDVETLSPTYRLVIGAPGRSNAFAIARRLGLDEQILQRAERMISPEDGQADALLTRVREAGDAAERAQQESERRLARLNQAERELQARLDAAEQARREVIEQAREQGRRELEQLRQEIRRLRQGLLPEAPPSDVLQEAAETLERLDESMSQTEEESAPPQRRWAGDLRVGDSVHISTLGQTGELVGINGQEAEVRIGGFRLRTRLRALEFRGRAPMEVDKPSHTIRLPQVESPGMELDLRGWRAEEVQPALEKYLDDAYLAGLPWVHVIHGKGMGVLKEVVRQLLGGHPLVARFRGGALDEGGEGVTVVELHKQET